MGEHKTGDRELLELAAKAAGIRIDKSPYNGGGFGNTGFDVAGNAVLDWHNMEKWNPLADDGDALRLAVRLGISIKNPDPEKIVFPHSEEFDARQGGVATAFINGSEYRNRAPDLRWRTFTVPWVSMAEFKRVLNCRDSSLLQFWRDNSPEKFENAYTATRRAIVRAAAELARGIEHHPSRSDT